MVRHLYGYDEDTGTYSELNEKQKASLADIRATVANVPADLPPAQLAQIDAHQLEKMHKKAREHLNQKRRK